ncbi:unnamed protein product, partial [Rotaria sordida]
MSGDKRKRGSLDSFVTVTKKILTTPSPSEQTELVTLDVAQETDGELEEPGKTDSTDINQNLIVIDSHPETHDNDIGFQLSLHDPPTNETKYRLLTKPFRPDKKYIFPNQVGKDGIVRRFMANWLAQYSFLSYSPFYEGAFCSPCALFSPLVSKQCATIFVHYPCSQVHQLKHFSTLIKIHLNSENHKLAIEREDVMSIREHLDTVEMPSGSNFISILKQRIDAGDQLLQTHLEKGHRNSTYTSPSVQNEIIELIHEHILPKILYHMGPETLYSIIVDGTTDSSNVEQLSFLIRFVDPHSNEIREDFLAFIPTTSSTDEAIADHILTSLKRYKLPLNNCIGQTYDGAPCMS